MVNHLVSMRGSIAAPGEVFDTPVRRYSDDGYSNESRTNPARIVAPNPILEVVGDEPPLPFALQRT